MRSCRTGGGGRGRPPRPPRPCCRAGRHCPPGAAARTGAGGYAPASSRRALTGCALRASRRCYPAAPAQLFTSWRFCCDALLPDVVAAPPWAVPVCPHRLSVLSQQGGTGVLPVQLFVPHPDPATASYLRRAAPTRRASPLLGAAQGVGLRAGAALRGQTALPIAGIAAISCPFGRISESPADHGHPSRRSCSPAAARVRHAVRRWSAHAVGFAPRGRSSVVWAAGPSPAQRATAPPPAICRRFHVGASCLRSFPCFSAARGRISACGFAVCASGAAKRLSPAAGRKSPCHRHLLARRAARSRVPRTPRPAPVAARASRAA